jgi:glutamate N-acetyltransferase/amino-acid N-acetyltransferase
MKLKYNWILNGGATSAMGFCAAGVAAGIKDIKKKDMALVVSDCDAVVAAIFTRNAIKAAPVKVSTRHRRGGNIRAVVFNSGNANACTGVQGIKDAMAMTEETAKWLGVRKTQVLVCSTGRIGVYLPMNKVMGGIKELAAKLSHHGGRSAAKAIMTSDTYPKECALHFELEGKNAVIGGMAKGAGMIHPSMATMLCLLTTDLAIEPSAFQNSLRKAADSSFNRISVDGDTSTNDTVLALANGLVRNSPLNEKHPEYWKFEQALADVMRHLARMIVEDGEGSRRVVDFHVQGAATEHDARLFAEAISRSPLVKASWAGGDPNWGRIISTLGASGVKVREEMVDIYYNGLSAVKGGVASSTPRRLLRREASKKSFSITVNLHLGKGTSEMWIADLTEDYVSINRGE